MDINNISSIVALLSALSIASERLVEIIKGTVPWLNIAKTDPNAEGWRQAALRVLAALAGVATAWLASTAEAVGNLIPSNPGAWIVLGLLASGGSGFWNSIQGYVNQAKTAKAAEAATKQAVASQTAVVSATPAGG